MGQRPSGISIRIREDLVAGSARTQTTLICDPIITLDGHRLVTADIGDICFAKINQGTSNEEIISFTGITDNTTTYTLTGCVWGYNFYNSTGSVEANKKKQNSGSSLIITNDDHYLATQYVNTDSPTASAAYIETTADNLTTKDYVDTRLGYWTGAVADYASLPAGAVDGEVRVTLDDSKIYVWDEDTTTWILAGAGGGAGTVYITTKMGTEADGDDNQHFSLTSGQWSDSKYLQVFLNGVLQELDPMGDYSVVDSNTIAFTNPILDTDKVTMLVVSVDLYNPAWGLVNASILPDTHNTYDIGATANRFKDLFLQGAATIEGNTDIDGTLNVEGVATFQASPVVPTATTATQAINKGDVDTAIFNVGKYGQALLGYSNSFYYDYGRMTVSSQNAGADISGIHYFYGESLGATGADSWGVFVTLPSAFNHSFANASTEINEIYGGFRMYDQQGASPTVYSSLGFCATLALSTTYSTAITANHAMFVFDSNSIYTSTADGTTQTKSSAIAATSLADLHYYRIIQTSANVLFYIDDVLVGTHTTNLPTGDIASVGFISRNASGANRQFKSQLYKPVTLLNTK